jgi:hypothetical protein
VKSGSGLSSLHASHMLTPYDTVFYPKADKSQDPPGKAGNGSSAQSG